MSFWEKVKLLASHIWDFIEPFIDVFLSEVGPILAKAAMSAVQATAANMSGASGADKRNAAYSAIVEDLKQQGIQIGTQVTTSMINAALEAAVQKFKASAPAAPAPAA